MIDLCWGFAIFLTLVGALHYWSARVFEVESFYGDAGLILTLALLCAGLARAWPLLGAW